MKPEINKDYIGVIKKENGNYIYEWRYIDADQQLISKIKALAEDDTKSILDMQACLAEHYDSDSKSSYNYSLHHAYNMPFIESIKYPVFISEAQHENECAKIAENVDDENIAEELRKYNNETKDEFLHLALRYILANAYNTKEADIKRDKSIILYSYETIGWNRWKYSPTEDIDIVLNTNFGMGTSSYITVDIRYKGQLLPSYSHLVRYYDTDTNIVNMNTRAYIPNRENWNEVLLFICDICKQAEQNSLGFVHSWVKHEVDTLRSGLEDLNVYPYKITCNTSTNGLYGVGNISHRDNEMYERYPTESAWTFHIRKITAALQFIATLRQLTDIYPTAAETADYIERHNRELAPQILEKIVTQQHMIERLNERLYPITELWRDIEERLNENPDDAQTLISKGRCDEKIDTLLNEIVNRNDFMKEMHQCYAAITKSGVLDQ